MGKVLNLAPFLESLITSKLRYYYLHHNAIFMQNGKHRQETFF